MGGTKHSVSQNTRKVIEYAQHDMMMTKWPTAGAVLGMWNDTCAAYMG